MKTYLIPCLMLVLLFSCKKDNDDNPKTEPTNGASFCEMAESYLLLIDSSKQILESYEYQSGRLVEIDGSNSQSGDTVTVIYWDNSKPLYALASRDGVVIDTLEKYYYDNKDRLIEVKGKGSISQLEYDENGLSKYTGIYTTHSTEFAITLKDGLIEKTMVLNVNGSPVDSNYQKEYFFYDDKFNPTYKTMVGQFNLFSYFNRNNTVRTDLYRNGVFQRIPSFEYVYEYNSFNYPVKVTSFSQTGGSGITSYKSYNCAVSTN